MNKYTIALCALGMAALGGCTSSAPDTRVIQLADSGAVAEIVNGTTVPQSLLEAVARGRSLHLDKPEQREQALKLTTDFVLMAQAVQRENLLKDAQFAADVEAARLKAVAEGGIAAFEKQTPVSDEVLKAQYDSEVGHAGKFEYDFGQLLFAEEGAALLAEEDVLAGKPFSVVFDTWRGKAKQAKIFTRIRADQLPADLVKVLVDMKAGDVTKLPVKTEFGWHVVHLDVANPFTPPPFEQVKEHIRSGVLLKAGQQRVEKMRELAKIEYPQGAAPAATPKSEAQAKQ
jgi:peptidyl-prolyl cis-trans isomerase C